MLAPVAFAPVAGTVRHAKGHRLHLGTVCPGAAAQDLLLALRWSLRILLRGLAVGVAVVPVARPLPDAAVHRVQAVAVGRKCLARPDRELAETVEIASVVRRLLVP